MAIRFQCSACSQPIEVDDEWALRTVACPYCRKTVTAPGGSTLPELSEIPTASPLAPREAGVLHPPAAGESTGALASSPNRVAVVAFGLACGLVLLTCLYLMVFSAHRLELEDLARPEQTFAENLQAFNEYVDQQGGRVPGWMVAMAVLPLSAVLVWIATLVCGMVGVRRAPRRAWALAALVIAGMVSVFFCCGGVIRL